MGVTAVRDAIAAAVDGLSGTGATLRCNEDGFMRDQVNPPEAMVSYELGDRITFDGPHEWTFHVMVFERRASERAAQVRFDEWGDPSHASSIVSAVEDDATVASSCQYARFRSTSEATAILIGEVECLMVDYTFEVVL